MSTVLWHTTMSLDGFIAGPGHSMDWARSIGHRSGNADAIRQGTGAILGGRNWYDIATEKYDGTAGIYGGSWSGPVFVLTSRPAPDDDTVTFLSGGIADAVATGLHAASGKALEIFGSYTATECLAAGLLDEIVVHVAPVLLGAGVRLYGSPAAATVQLDRVPLEPGDGPLADLRYRIRRQG